jgi:hypothetical protein
LGFGRQNLRQQAARAIGALKAQLGYRMREARNVNQFTFEQYALGRQGEAEMLRGTLAAMKVLLLKVLAPRCVAGMGGLMGCRDVAPWVRTRSACGTGTVCGAP